MFVETYRGLINLDLAQSVYITTRGVAGEYWVAAEFDGNGSEPLLGPASKEEAVAFYRSIAGHLVGAGRGPSFVYDAPIVEGNEHDSTMLEGDE